jgi:hypothetical protein
MANLNGFVRGLCSPYDCNSQLQLANGSNVARFRRIDKDQPNVHHDALEFPSADIVLVHRLCLGQRLTVLQLPAPAPLSSKQDELFIV